MYTSHNGLPLYLGALSHDRTVPRTNPHTRNTNTSVTQSVFNTHTDTVADRLLMTSCCRLQHGLLWRHRVVTRKSLYSVTIKITWRWSQSLLLFMGIRSFPGWLLSRMVFSRKDVSRIVVSRIVIFPNRTFPGKTSWMVGLMFNCSWRWSLTERPYHTVGLYLNGFTVNSLHCQFATNQLVRPR